MSQHINGLESSIGPLYEGFLSFKRTIFPTHHSLYQELAAGQAPRALFITCSDSRVVPELILQAKPGDLFVCRNAGNLVPPHGDPAGGVAATIEYAVGALNVPNVIICGHTGCGAMDALVYPEKVSSLPSVAAWLRYAEAAKQVLSETQHDHSKDDFAAELERENVVAQLEHLKTHPSVASRIARGNLNIFGWIYNIREGAISAYDAASGSFGPLDERFVTATPKPRLQLVKRHKSIDGQSACLSRSA
jgi:carbonic anhydrase